MTSNSLWNASEGPKITQKEILITLFSILSNMGNVVKWVIINTFRLYDIGNYYYIKLLKVSWHLMCYNSSYCIKILYVTEITKFHWQLDCNQIICLLTFMGSYCCTPLDCKEIQPVHPKGDQSWVFIGKTDAEAETPILWPPHARSWLIGKDPDAGRDWGQEEKGTTEDEMAGWHHRLDGHEFE